MGYDMKRLICIEPVLLLSLLLVFAAAAYQRNFVWKDDLSLKKAGRRVSNESPGY